MSLSRLFRRREKISFTEYDHEVREFHLPDDGRVEYARWLHPYESPKDITQEDVDALRWFVRSGDFVIDIGAHTGDTSVPLALAAGAAGCTLALEPNPYVYKVLATNASLNRDKTNIRPECFAATEDEGKFVFHYSDAAFCNGGFKSQQRSWRYRRQYPLTVDGRNLLRVLNTEYAEWLPKLSYVKVDAEGYDRAVLESILPVIRQQRPVIRTEVFRKLHSSERHALFDLLADIGYRLHRFEYAAEPIGRPLQRPDMVREKHFDILALPESAAGRAAA